MRQSIIIHIISSHFSCGKFFPHDNLSCPEFVHMTIFYVENLSTWHIFSTGITCGTRDKYEIWVAWCQNQQNSTLAISNWNYTRKSCRIKFNDMSERIVCWGWIQMIRSTGTIWTCSAQRFHSLLSSAEKWPVQSPTWMSAQIKGSR